MSNILRYGEFPEIKETYIVNYMTGCGVMESPFEEKEIVYKSDSLEDCENYIKEHYPYKEWQFHHGIITANTLTEEGKKLLKVFQGEWFSVEEKIKNNPQNYTTYTTNDGMKITLENNNLLDGIKN